MKYLLSILLLLPINSFCQANFPYFGQVSDDDLEMTVYEKDSSAAAVYLMNYCKARYDEIKKQPYYYYDYHYQIKLLNRSAFDEADIAFYFYKKRPVENLKAVIHYIEDGERKSTEVTEFQTIDVSKYTKAYKFAFPNVKEGAVLEYRYTRVSNSIALPRDFYFQKKYPVKHAEYHFIFPGYRDYQMLQPDLKFDEFDYREVPMTKRLSTTKTLTEYWWKAYDIPGLPSEPYINNVMDYRHKIRLQVVSFFIGGGTKENKYKPEWMALGADFQFFLDRYYENYRPTPQVRKILKPLKEQITGTTSDIDKLRLLYDYVQNSIEWNEQYTRFLTQSMEDTYKDKSGTSADINLFLYRLLKHYGMEVYPIMVSSRENGRITKEYPFVEQFDHLILQVNIYDRKIIIDATDKTYPYDLLPAGAIGQEGFLVKKGGSTFINLNLKKAEHTQTIDATITPVGTIQGTINAIYKNYAAHDVREMYKKDGKETYQSTYFEQSTDFKINELITENLEDKNKALVENLTFEINDVVQVADDLLYCNALMGMNPIEHPFKAKTRKLPIELLYPSLNRNIIKVKIPDGYAIESLPEDLNISLPKNGGEYTFAITQKDNVIAITSSIYIKRLYFEIEEYEEIQEFFNQIEAIQNSQIVLKQN